MNLVTDRELGKRLFSYSGRELNAARNGRDLLKFLLARAKTDGLKDWIEALSVELERARRRIQRLSAKHSRLKKRLARPDKVVHPN